MAENGYTGYTVCSVCGYEIAKGEDIPEALAPYEKPAPKTGDNGIYMRCS